MNFSASVEIRAVYPTHSNLAALRAACYLWVADPRQVTFLCAAEEKSPKETPPRMAQPNPALLRLWGPRLTHATHSRHPLRNTSAFGHPGRAIRGAALGGPPPPT